jgi:hypothetical protein
MTLSACGNKLEFLEETRKSGRSEWRTHTHKDSRVHSTQTIFAPS